MSDADTDESRPVTTTTTTAPAPAAPAAEGRANNRKVREGIVVSDRMDKTAIVLITSRVRHARYNKTLQHHKKLYVHDPGNDLSVGDRVRLQETRPISKLKRWRVIEVLERAR
jgi:small subunit ribosomal protein S17